MSIKNETVTGLSNFIKAFHKDLLDGVATGWWGEVSGHKGDYLGINFLNKDFLNVYELIEFIKDNKETLEDKDLKYFGEQASIVNFRLERKRHYMYEIQVEDVVEPTIEVSEDDFTEDKIENNFSESISEEEFIEQMTLKEQVLTFNSDPSELQVVVVESEKVQEVEDVQSDVKTPDWDLAKSYIVDLPDAEAKVALVKYASEFGITEDCFDKRKGYSKLLATFRGKWNALNKVK